MKFAKNIVTLTALTGILSFSRQAAGGSTDGPFVIWSNLGAADTRIVNDKVKEYLLSGDNFCWQKGSSLMYMTKRSADITDDLIRKSLIVKNKVAINELNKRLLNYEHSHAWSGFDGVIAYTDRNGQG